MSVRYVKIVTISHCCCLTAPIPFTNYIIKSTTITNKMLVWWLCHMCSKYDERFFFVDEISIRTFYCSKTRSTVKILSAVSRYREFVYVKIRSISTYFISGGKRHKFRILYYYTLDLSLVIEPRVMMDLQNANKSKHFKPTDTRTTLTGAQTPDEDTFL